jgi:hypothetical protein
VDPPIKKNGSFADRFSGRTSTISREGESSISKNLRRPIEKLNDTNSSIFSHLHTTALGGLDTISSGPVATPRYSLRNHMQ